MGTIQEIHILSYNVTGYSSKTGTLLVIMENQHDV